MSVALVGGCDSGKAETSYLRFSPTLPRTLVAGQPLTVTAVGESNRPYDRAEVFVFRDRPRFGLDGSFTGDTLFAQRLDVTPGVLEFRASAVITVPADAVAQPEQVWAYIVAGNGGSGTEIQLLPAP